MDDYEKELDEYILHMAELAMYANTLADDVLGLASSRLDGLGGIVEEFGPVRTKGRYRELLATLDEGSPLFIEMVSDALFPAVGAVASLEMGWLERLLSPVYRGKVKPPARLVEKLLMSTYDGRTSIQDYPALLSSRLMSASTGAAKSMHLFSVPNEDARKAVDEYRPVAGRGVSSDVATIMDSTARGTERLVYEGIGSVRELVWVSTLDGRTCIVCGTRHGMRFAKGSEPMCPAHHRCRCILAPAREGFSPPSYSEWLSRQTEETKYRILGRSRYRLYKEGMGLDRFVSDGRKLRLDEIE